MLPTATSWIYPECTGHKRLGPGGAEVPVAVLTLVRARTPGSSVCVSLPGGVAARGLARLPSGGSGNYLRRHNGGIDPALSVGRWQVLHLLLGQVEPDPVLDLGHRADRDGDFLASP